METRSVFLALVCVVSLAFGEEQQAIAKQRTLVPATAASPGTAPGQNTPGQSPTKPTVTLTTPAVPTGVQSPSTPAPAKPAPVTATEPPFTGMSMRFHAEGSFDVTFEMNVNQGQAKQGVCTKAHAKPK